MDKKALKTDILAVRISPKLKRDFQKAAAKDYHSMAGALVIAIKAYIARINSGKAL